jgi:hypothetical protein
MATDDTLSIDPSQLLGAPGAAPRAQPVTIQDLSQYLSNAGRTTPAVTTGPATLDINTPVFSSLSQARSSFAQELQNPENRRLLIASIRAEVGDQGTEARLGYTESVMNRALASNRSLQNTIIDPYDPSTGKGYYPPATMNQLNRSVSDKEYAQYNPIIDRALGGSNLSNLATGNESGHLHSMPVTYDPGSGERFVDERPYSDWRAKAQQNLSNPPPQPAQQLPSVQQIQQNSDSSPTMDLSRYLSSG